MGGGGFAPTPRNPPGLGLYPSIREPQRYVVMLIVHRMCEMLRNTHRFHEYAMFYHCLNEVKLCENQ